MMKMPNLDRFAKSPVLLHETAGNQEIQRGFIKMILDEVSRKAGYLVDSAGIIMVGTSFFTPSEAFAAPPPRTTMTPPPPRAMANECEGRNLILTNPEVSEFQGVWELSSGTPSETQTTPMDLDTDAGDTDYQLCPPPKVLADGQRELTGENCQAFPFKGLIVRLDGETTVNYPVTSPDFELQGGTLWVAEYYLERPTKARVIVRSTPFEADVTPTYRSAVVVPEGGQMVRIYSAIGETRVDVAYMQQPVMSETMKQGAYWEIPLVPAGAADAGIDSSVSGPASGPISEPTPTPRPVTCNANESANGSNTPTSLLAIGMMLVLRKISRKKK